MPSRDRDLRSSPATWRPAVDLVHIEVIEIPLGLDLPPDPEDVGGAGVGVELDEVRLAVPEVAGVADQVVDLVRLAVAAPRPSSPIGTRTQPDWVWCGSRLTTTRITFDRSGVALP